MRASLLFWGASGFSLFLIILTAIEDWIVEVPDDANLSRPAECPASPLDCINLDPACERLDFLNALLVKARLRFQYFVLALAMVVTAITATCLP